MNVRRKKVMLVLVLAGLAVSAYLTYSKLNASPFWCNFGKCSVVQSSSFSVLFGLPVAAWGAMYYIVLGALILKNMKKPLDLALAWGLVYSAYLTYIEIFVIKAICGWCVTSFVIIILLALLHYDLPFVRSRRIRT